MLGGATTGDWLVLFCEIKMKKRLCGEMYEFWNELSGELAGRLTVATVDTYVILIQAFKYAMTNFVLLLFVGIRRGIWQHGLKSTIMTLQWYTCYTRITTIDIMATLKIKRN